MSNFIIDPSSVSFSQIKADLQAFLDSAVDAQEFSAFFASSTGQKIVNLVAGLGALTQYNTVVARREGFIQYAENEASIVGAAQTQGYSAFRGRNTILTLTVVPNFSGLLSRFALIGTFQDNDLILLEDTVVNAGVAVDLDVAVGVLNEEDITVTGDGPLAFRFTQNLVSDDIRLFLNDTEVDISERIIDLINEKFVAQTNPLGSVDVKYLNLDNFAVQYIAGDILKLEWIERRNVDEITLDELTFDFGTLTSFVVESIFVDKESKDSVKVNAPLFNETQFLIRGRNDFLKIFKLLSTEFADTDGRDISPAVVGLQYVKNELDILSQNEKDDFVDQFNRPLGVQPAIIEDPILYFLKLDLELKLNTSVAGDPIVAVRTELEKFEKDLNVQLDFDTVEENLESLDFVRIARIKIGSEDRVSSNSYLLGNTYIPTSLTDEDIVFEVTRLICRSGTVEPSCPGDEGDEVLDGNIIWEAKDPLALGICDVVAQLDLWAASTDYVPGDRVRLTGPCDYILEMVECQNFSNFIQEIQLIEFSAVPASGTWRIEVGAESTTDLAFDADATDVQNALNALSAFDSVSVTGDYSSGFTCALDPNEDHTEFTFADAGQNEIQCLQPNLVPTSGSWKLTFLGDETAALAFNINAATLQSELEALPSIGAGNVQVSGGLATRFLVEFISDLGLANQPDITVSDNTLVAGAAVAATPSTVIEGEDPDAGQNEIQDITFDKVPDAGSFSLRFDGQTTDLMNESVTAGDVEDALENLDTITPGEVSVTGSFAAGFTVEFQNALGNQDVSLIEVVTNDLTFNQAVVTSVATIQEGGGGFNETQEIEFDLVPDAGQWKITYSGEETELLSFGATNEVVQAALVALSNIGVDGNDDPNVEVSGDFDNGFIISFINDLANTNVSEVTISFNTLTKAIPITIDVVETTPGRPVDAGQDEQQRIDFDFVPDSGNFQIEFDSETTANIPYTASNTDVENALNALTNLSAVSVSGDFTNGFVIDFTGADGTQDQPEITIALNTLNASSAPISFDTCAEAQEGRAPASNLFDGGSSPITITPSTTTEGADPEPDWPGTAECPV